LLHTARSSTLRCDKRAVSVTRLFYPPLVVLFPMANVYFASDTHFGAGSAESQASRETRFVAWLDSIAPDDRLYLLGDIFDFWLDYPNYMPKGNLEVLYGLRRVLDRGVEVRFVGGNHDIWCAEYLEANLGIETLPCGVVVEHQGVRLRLDHGDGLLSGDRFYRIFRAAVRTPALVFLAKSLHPELLHRFASWLSSTSRKSHNANTEEILGMIRRYGELHSHADVDYLVVGHIHVPTQQQFEGWVFTCLGDWVAHSTVGRLREGKLDVVPVP